jgi:tellurite resistance protein TerC
VGSPGPAAHEDQPLPSDHGDADLEDHGRILFRRSGGSGWNPPVENPIPFAVLAQGTGGFDRWAEFLGLVILLLCFDLFVVHRRAHVVPFKEALRWSVFWIGLALLFNAWIWWEYSEKLGPEAGASAASDFLAAYVMEKSLSVDNLFVFVVLFNFFKVPPEYRHRVLFFGILGALVLRALFLVAGIQVLHLFKPSFVLFGLLLLATAWKLAHHGGAEIDPEKTLFYRLGRRILPLVPRYEGGRFFVKEGGKVYGTTLLLVLFVIEGTDVVFALDSVPACLGITTDMFIVYTSNVFAILGLRALFFLLQGVLESIPGLQAGLALVLAFVGTKMILIYAWPNAHRLFPSINPDGSEFHVDSKVSLGVIVFLLVGSWAIASLLRRGEKAKERDAG